MFFFPCLVQVVKLNFQNGRFCHTMFHPLPDSYTEANTWLFHCSIGIWIYVNDEHKAVNISFPKPKHFSSGEGCSIKREPGTCFEALSYLYQCLLIFPLFGLKLFFYQLFKHWKLFKQFDTLQGSLQKDTLKLDMPNVLIRPSSCYIVLSLCYVISLQQLKFKVQ